MVGMLCWQWYYTKHWPLDLFSPHCAISHTWSKLCSVIFLCGPVHLGYARPISPIHTLLKRTWPLKPPPLLLKTVHFKHWSLVSTEEGTLLCLALKVLMLCFSLRLAQNQWNHHRLSQHYNDTVAHQADMFGDRWSQRACRDCLKWASHLPLTRNPATDGRGLHGGKEGVSKNISSTLTSLTQRW